MAWGKVGIFLLNMTPGNRRPQVMGSDRTHRAFNAARFRASTSLGLCSSAPVPGEGV